MIFNKDFEGILSKFANKKKKDSDTPVAQVSIKFTAQHPDLLSDVNDVFKTDNISKYSDQPSKFKVALSTNVKVNVEFEDMTFDAKLVEVVMAKKETKDDIIFNYELKFEKEIENNDLVLATFLNQKEEDENGKEKLVLHTVTITKSEDESDVK